MYEFWQMSYGLWSANKDTIAVVFLSLFGIWKVFSQRIKSAASMVWSGVKYVFRRKPVILANDVADIILNVTEAKLVPGTKVLKHLQVEYHPGGVVKLQQEVWFDGLQARTMPQRVVAMTNVERKAVKQYYDERLKTEEVRVVAETREEAATPDLPKWQNNGATGGIPSRSSRKIV